MSRVWCASVGVALLLAATVVAGGAATPEAAFKDFQAAVKAKDGNKTWALLAKDSQAKMELMAGLMKEQFKKLADLPEEQRKAIEEQLTKAFGMTLAEIQKMDGKAMLTFSLKNAAKFGKGDPFADVAESTLEDVKVDGDKATAKVKTKTKTEPLEFRKEGGSWKIQMPDNKK